MIKTPLQYTHMLIEIGPKDRLTYFGTPMLAVSYDEKAHRLQYALDPTKEVRIRHEELYEAFKNDNAGIEYDFYSKSQTKLRLVVGDLLMKDFSDKKQLKARFKEWLILKYEEHCRVFDIPTGDELDVLLEEWTTEYLQLKDERDDNNKRVKKKRRLDSKKQTLDDNASPGIGAPSTRTFDRWINEYMSCGRDVRGLLPRNRGPGIINVKMDCPESVALWRLYVRSYMSRTRPSKVKALRDCVAAIHEENESREKANQNPDNEFRRFLTPPTKNQFLRLVDELDEHHVMAGRDGIDVARAYYKAKMNGFDVERPGAIVMFDTWNVDCMTLLTAGGLDLWHKLPEEIQELCKVQRVWIVAAVDVATRYVLGIQWTLSESSKAVVEALRLVMTDKSLISALSGAKTPWVGHCRPQAAYADNGPGYIAQATRDAFKASRIDYTNPPAGIANKRPHIESLFSQFAKETMSYFDARTFSNVVEKGKYKPQDFVSLTVAEFIRLFTRAICDIYHLTPSPKLNNASPHNAWRDKTQRYPVREIGYSEMRNVFGIIRKRSVNQEGVVVNGIPYNSERLQKFRRKFGQSKRFEIKFDPQNVHAISFRDPDAGWFPVSNRIGLDNSFSVEAYSELTKEIRAVNGESARATGPDLYRAINVMRKAGESARHRTGLSPFTPSAEDYVKLEKELTEGRILYDIEVPSIVPSDEDVIPHDDLFEGNIAGDFNSEQQDSGEEPVGVKDAGVQPEERQPSEKPEVESFYDAF